MRPTDFSFESFAFMAVSRKGKGHQVSQMATNLLKMGGMDKRTETSFH